MREMRWISKWFWPFWGFSSLLRGCEFSFLLLLLLLLFLGCIGPFDVPSSLFVYFLWFSYFLRFEVELAAVWPREVIFLSSLDLKTLVLFILYWAQNSVSEIAPTDEVYELIDRRSSWLSSFCSRKRWIARRMLWFGLRPLFEKGSRVMGEILLRLNHATIARRS